MKKLLFICSLFWFTQSQAFVFSGDMRQRVVLGFVIGAITNFFGQNVLYSNLWGISVNQLMAYLGYTIPYYELLESEIKFVKIYDLNQRDKFMREFTQRKKNYTVRAYGSNFLGYLLGSAFANKLKSIASSKEDTTRSKCNHQYFSQ